MIPDLVHINHIRRRLWIGREFGQAAVMVGAGFSLQADALSSSAPAFPLWRDLANRFVNELGLPPAVDASVLDLASEYETFFGRAALDKLLIDAIPDEQYAPGRLHEILLSLPWSDVFTTNYDTLLERTGPRVYHRRHEVILTCSDIPGKMKPRITKLHGSFPSHRPFISTEEDYRTYPRIFAPFVNLVQQSLMENIFCLIGFSGDDPNFLNWAGWVRDNLGDAAQPMYLCGLLNLTPSRRQLLRARNVIPIDLSPLSIAASDPAVRHSKALEWLLLTFAAAAPPNPLLWPVSSTVMHWPPSPGVPPIPPLSP